ncbi:MAG: hypothetical protein IPL79_03405 [Myxococcales bacterium]|nr:hypothetical protein [Myxococcales bacterium]
MKSLTRSISANAWCQQLAAAVLVFGLFGALASAGNLSAPQRAVILGRGADALQKSKQRVEKRKDVYAQQAKRRDVSFLSLGGAAASTTMARFKGGADGKRYRLVLRQPRRGAAWGVAANDTILLLAEQLGGHVQVPGAIVADVATPASQDVAQPYMLMSAVSSDAMSADKASSRWLGRVSENTRISAAVIDLLVDHHDRKLSNVMVTEQGEVSLVDPDSVFGAKSSAYRSSFFPGERLGYSSQMTSAKDLPWQARDLIDALTSATVAEIQGTYGISAEQALGMQQRAKLVQDHGLTSAIARHVATLKTKRDTSRD